MPKEPSKCAQMGNENENKYKYNNDDQRMNRETSWNKKSSK